MSDDGDKWSDEGPAAMMRELLSRFERMQKEAQAQIVNTRHGLMFDVPGDELALQLSERAKEAKDAGLKGSENLFAMMARCVNPSAVYVLSAYDLTVVLGHAGSAGPTLGVLP